MALAAGTRIGSYEVLAPLGAGGMGEVYRARDRTLNRDVAIKVLPEAFSGDPERVARFEREAKILASLNHPQIAAIYGLETSGPTQALVLELVEGPTLADRLARGPLSIGEVRHVARQIAQALAAAHDAGIVHRDLKPANIKLRADGTVKILDFGIAKTTSAGTSDAGAYEASTVTSPLTEHGVILGTAAYMSPEQARGQPVDKRADIWAFGCVLFEMLSGRRGFSGRTATEVLAAVLEREPPWDAIPAHTPPAIQRLLRRCLVKDEKRRLRDIGDAAIELDETSADVASPRVEAPPGRRALWGWAAAAVIALSAGTALWILESRQTSPDIVRLSLSAPGVNAPQSVAVSPDGRNLAYIAPDASGQTLLWVRALDSSQARALAGTENAGQPFWSRDGRSLGFWMADTIARIDATGGPVQTVAGCRVRSKAAWSSQGTILFEDVDGLKRVSDAGGAVTTVALHDAAGHALSAFWPQFLPDGRHFLFLGAGGAGAKRGIYGASLDSPTATFLLATSIKPQYARGYLLFVKNEDIYAQPLDVDHWTLTGSPTLVAGGVWTAVIASQAAYSVSDTGVLAYVNASLLDWQLVWFSRSGQRLSAVGPPAESFGEEPELSPDGKWLAISEGQTNAHDIMLIDLATAHRSRLTFDPADDIDPIWSRDGQTVLFESDRNDDKVGLYRRRADKTGGVQEIVDDVGVSYEDVSRDGRFVLYSTVNATKHLTLWVKPVVGNRKAFPYIDAAYNVNQAQFSPDGRWVAYVSDETTKDEVYVQSFPTPGSKQQVSVAGGVQPRWRRDGREIFYVARDGQLTVRSVTPGSKLEMGDPRALFQLDIPFVGTEVDIARAVYDVSADGQRVVVNGAPERPGPSISVVLNWTAALKR